MSENRKRKIRIVMHLTDEENDILSQRIRASNADSRESYLRKMALTGYILRVDMSEVRETMRLMANATSNINQIARRANETRSIYASDMIQLREEIGSLRKQVADALKNFGKIQKLLDLYK